MRLGRQTSLSLTWLALIWPALSAVAFTFTNTAPSTCDPLTVTWKGGQPPFRLQMIAPERIFYNFTIPSNLFNNNSNTGSYTIPMLPLPVYQRVMFTMSDATGLATGGTTSLLTVGNSKSAVVCNVTSPNPDFFYSLDTDLAECQPYTFSLYPNAVQPVTIYGFIPSEPPFTLSVPTGDSWDWTANLTSGTPVAFYMQDALGRDGGVSQVAVVRLSGDTSCRTASSSSTITTSPTSTSSGQPSSSSKSNIALIAGAAAGGGAAVLLICLIVGCCMWRRRPSASRPRLPMVRKGTSKETVDLLDDDREHHATDPSLGHYVVEPFVMVEPFVVDANSSTPSLTGTGMGTGTGGPSTQPLTPLSRKEQMRMAIMNEPNGGAGGSTSGHTIQTTGYSTIHSRAPSGVQLSEFGVGAPSEYLGVGGSSSRYSTAPTSAGTSLGQGGGSYGPSLYVPSHPSREGLLSPGGLSPSDRTAPNSPQSSFSGGQRVIVHTDIAETELDDDQPLELPPMYSEGRRPIPGLNPPQASRALPEAPTSDASPDNTDTTTLPPPLSRKGP